MLTLTDQRAKEVFRNLLDGELGKFCYCESKTDGSVYLRMEITSIPDEAATETPKEEFSSTRVRKLILDRQARGQLGFLLKPMALNVDRLLEYVEDEGL